MTGTMRSVLGGLIAALVLALVPSAAAAPHHPAVPGRPVARTVLPADQWLPGSADAYRQSYTSTAVDGSITTVTGAMFVPSGHRPLGGWPVISWAHGTVGIADGCAPSTQPRSARDVAYLSALLAHGYAVVATDYVGLGTPGIHPYLDGRTEAYATIDMVRAAVRADHRLSRRWLASGQSQGAQAALFVAALATKYAPELDYRGAIATAPATQSRMTITDTGALLPDRPANPFLALVLGGLAVSHPGAIDAGDYLTAAGMQVYRSVLDTDCFGATAARMAGHPNRDFYDIDAAELDALIRILDANDVPITKYSRAVFLAQGTTDTIVYPPATAETARQLAAAGAPLTFRTYDDTDHNGLLAAALPDLLAFIADRFAPHHPAATASAASSAPVDNPPT